MAKESNEHEKQIGAITKVYAAVKGLSAEAARSVLDYVGSMVAPGTVPSRPFEQEAPRPETGAPVSTVSDTEATEGASNGGAADGISSVGHKWMRRNGIAANDLETVFSLGLEEIDLVAKTVPGKSTREKMRSVFLLKGISAYLGSGAARFSHEQVREACHHYSAWDKGNFANYFKSFASEVSGTKGSGYTLSARGLAAGTEVVKQMLLPGSSTKK